jgi:hypothetical protein
MHRAMIGVVLVIGLAGRTQAGDLTAAGAISGFGQGMANSLSVIQQGLIQQSLMEEQARFEREKMEQLHRYQMERDKLQYQRELERQQTMHGQTERQGLSGQPVRAEARTHVEAIRELEKTHPDWREMTASGSPYRQWLATQPASYQQLINTTWDPAVVVASIDQFRSTQQTAIKRDLEQELQMLQLEQARLQQEQAAVNAMPAASPEREHSLVVYKNHLHAYHARLDAYYVKSGQYSLAQREALRNSQQYAEFEELAKRVQKLRAQQEQAE